MATHVPQGTNPFAQNTQNAYSRGLAHSGYNSYADMYTQPITDSNIAVDYGAYKQKLNNNTSIAKLRLPSNGHQSVFTANHYNGTPSKVASSPHIYTGQTDPFGNKIFSDSGGMGSYGWVSDGTGGKVGLDKAAYTSIQNNGSGGLAFGKGISSGTNWFGKGGYLDTGAQVVGAAGALLQGYTALGQLGLAKRKFGFEKGLANRNVFNQGTLANNTMDNQTLVSNALAGNTLTGAQRNTAIQNTNNRHVNVSAIG